MIELEPLQDSDFDAVEQWNRGKSRDFLVQWSGPLYEYPLTAAYLREHHAGHSTPGADTFIYRIMLDGAMIGMVQLLRIDRATRSAVVGRFLIGEESARNRGYGEQALREAVRIGFEEFGLNTLFLTVFDFNKNAIRCYEKVGFEAVDFEPEFYAADSGPPWGKVRMKITSYQWKAAEGCM